MFPTSTYLYQHLEHHMSLGILGRLELHYMQQGLKHLGDQDSYEYKHYSDAADEIREFKKYFEKQIEDDQSSIKKDVLSTMGDNSCIPTLSFKDRAFKERNELQESIWSLEKYIDSIPKKDNFPEAEMKRLEKQLKTMRDYYDILDERIRSEFCHKGENDA